MNDLVPEQLTLSSLADYTAALDKLCALAEHTLYVFDKTLEGQGFNTQSRYTILRNFLLGNPARKFCLLVHDTHYLSTRCPHMLDLLHHFGTQTSSHQTPHNLQHLAVPFAVADGTHLVRRFHFNDARGVFATHDPSNAHALKTRFLEMWTASHPTTTTVRLSL
jgi:hypothetical protein